MQTKKKEKKQPLHRMSNDRQHSRDVWTGVFRAPRHLEKH